MPSEILKPGDLSPGEIYEDCFYHPCLCVRVEADGEVDGISLVNGTYPRNCDIANCGLRKLTVQEALKWRLYGPDDAEIQPASRWWGPTAHHGQFNVVQEEPDPQGNP